MKLEDFLKMPVGMTPEQWEHELERQDKIKKKIRSLSFKRDDYEDGYALTRDQKWKDKLDKVNDKIAKLAMEIEGGN